MLSHLAGESLCLDGVAQVDMRPDVVQSLVRGLGHPQQVGNRGAADALADVRRLLADMKRRGIKRSDVAHAFKQPLRQTAQRHVSEV